MKKIVCLLLLTLCKLSFSQRIGGYFPNYAYTTLNAQNIQYDKLTHLYYFSLNPRPTSPAPTDGELWFNDTYSWFTTTRFNDVVAKARAKNPNIKIIIVSGGAPGSDATLNTRFEYIGSNPSINRRFCDRIIQFIKANNLYGWDFDWEYPNTASARAAHQNILALMRSKIDSLKIAECKNYEISIAVGGGYYDASCWNPTHLSYVNNSVINFVDYVNVMTYDGPVGSSPCGFSSHVHYNMYTNSFNTWRTSKSWPASKFQLGTGFYDNNYNLWRNNATATNYNSTHWGNGGDGCINIRNKIDFNRANSVAGIFAWELTQDNLCSGTVPSCYSLLDCMYQRTIATGGLWTEPGNPCPTPVNLINIHAKVLSNHSILNWSVANEKDIFFYEIEISNNGEDFYSVTKVFAKGNNDFIINYAESIPYVSGVVRLKAVDANNNVLMQSNIINLTFYNNLKVLVYPNPFEKSIFLKLDDNIMNAEVKIIDLVGNIVFSKFIYNYNQIVDLETDNLSKGKYIIKIKLDDGFIIHSVIDKY